MNNPDDLQSDFQDDSHDGLDPKLQKLYRQLPKEQPSAALDAKILAAAKITAPNQVQRQKKRHHWQVPFAFAASVVMVTSVVLHLHKENPEVFDAPPVQTAQAPAASKAKPETNSISEPQPAVEMAKPTVNDAANDLRSIPAIANTKPLADIKITALKATNVAIATPEEAQSAGADVGILAEKKAETANHTDPMAETNLANKSAKVVQKAILAKEQEAQQAETEIDQLATAAPVSTPASIIAPVPQMQLQQEVAKLDSLQAGLLQDSNRASRQMSAAPMAVTTINSDSFSSAVMPMAKQRAQRDEEINVNKADDAQNISAPILSIEGVAMGMSREQLITQGLMCYVDVCHLDLSQPQSSTYWGMPAQNAHLTASLSRHVVTKMVLQQKNVSLENVKTSLSNVGIESQQSCIEEKGKRLISRQLGVNIFNVRSTGAGLSLVICQQTKPLNPSLK